MRPTRQLQSIGGLTVALLVGAVLTARTSLLIGAVTFLSGILVLVWQGLKEFTTIQDSLTVEVVAAEHRTVPDGIVPLTISATLSESVPAPVTLSLSYGPGVSGPTETLTLDPGETNATVVHEVDFPVAGQFDIPTIQCLLEDSSSVVTERYEIEAADKITVEPAAPTNIHIGQGGDQIGGQYGEHRSAATGSGLEIAELREYRPGDSVGKIDWKATARLRETYVREFEAETTQQMTLLVDSRPQLWDGPRGRSKLAYLREVALGFIEMAEEAADPVALSVIETAGIRTQYQPAETATHYQRLRWTLRNLGPSQPVGAPPSRVAVRGPSEASHIAQQLELRDSEYAQTLRPYLSEPGSYIDRLADDPLFEAVHRLVETATQSTWTLLFTDDTDPQRTIEAAKIAAKQNRAVTVFLTPSTLFTTEGGIQQDYQEYLEFEELRRALDALPRVAAYEVAPGDRVESVLANGRQETRQQVRGSQ